MRIKKLFLFMPVAAILLSTVNVAPNVLAASNVNWYWNLDEGTGTVAYDSSGNGVNGNLVGGAAWNTDAVMGNNLNFSSNGSAVKVNSTNMSFGDVFTIAAWIKAPANRSNYRIIVAKDSNGTASHFDLKLDITTGFLTFYSPNLGNISSGITVDDNTWHHVAVTYAQGQMKFYVDGNLAKTVLVNGRISDSTSALAIGALTEQAYSFGGNISQVKIYKSVLNSIKIANLYTNKLANWDLNDGMGITTNEDSGNQNYGSLQGAVWATDSKFGNVISFGAAGSKVQVTTTKNLNLKNRFTISGWVKAPNNRGTYRIMLAKGPNTGGTSYFDFKLEPTTGFLSFYSPALAGDTNSGVTVDDNTWHHVAVTYQPGQMNFYKDGILVKTSQVTGTIADSTSSLAIGALNESAYSFGGSLARFKIFGVHLI